MHFDPTLTNITYFYWLYCIKVFFLLVSWGISGLVLNYFVYRLCLAKSSPNQNNHHRRSTKVVRPEYGLWTER